MIDWILSFVMRTIALFKTFLTNDHCDVNETIDAYNTLHDDKAHDSKARKSHYMTLVNAYYSVATAFYEWGWGESFHFAQQWNTETLPQAIIRHEYQLALQLGIKSHHKVLDVGCGIGGPMRNIARFTGCSVTGINNNGYQIKRGNEENQKRGFTKCNLIKADFLNMPCDNNSFDAVYAIEATCHAPNLVDVYREIFRTLKPGGVFGAYEWCMTPKFNKNNPEHLRLKKLIEEGDGLPDLNSTEQCVAALKEAGFQVEYTNDLVLEPNEGGKPWYYPLTPSYVDLTRFQHTPLGRALSVKALRALEFLRIAPSGTAKVQDMLTCAADGLVGAGRLGIYTPMFLVVARKPAQAGGKKK